MATKTIIWSDGSTATLTYTGQGNGTIVVTSDPNNHYESRSAQITVKTTDGSNIAKTITIVQAAKVRVDISSAVVSAANQTYSGSALTPTPTVTLNGETIPSSGYDVAYSNNTNAGTATVTVTGKGDYTGTATGTFTIAKANPTYTAPTARTGLTYSGSSQYLVTAGSTSHGTIQYSSNGTTWSTTRPSSTNAGSYTTYWRLVGDSNHNDVASTSLSTTIAKANRTLSFADSYVVLNTSSNVTKTATPSAGSGDGAITYSISSTTYATINSSSGKVTSKTSDGSATVTATIAEGTNYLSATASYNLYVFATTHNYDYNGSYRSITLPPGTYQFQCWGAQGGSNAAASSYGITAQAGGKGGYSVGQLTVAQATSVRIYVGGQGSSSSGGFNGGGSTTGSSSYNSGGIEGVSRMGGGGGATDIRLSDGALLSRMIVAGGGSGGAMAYKKTTTSSIQTVNMSGLEQGSLDKSGNAQWEIDSASRVRQVGKFAVVPGKSRINCTLNTSLVDRVGIVYCDSNGTPYSDGGWKDPATQWDEPGRWYIGASSRAAYVRLYFRGTQNITPSQVSSGITAYCETTVESVTTETNSHIGWYGGGVTGGAYRDRERATQTSGGGEGGSFGNGANQTSTNYRYAAGAGGGGWYGGSTTKSDASMFGVQCSAGGSGWVNTSASAGNRPSGYTGLQLDSGETNAGNTSFPNTSGTGNETGHSGNGYARITRLS